MTWSHTPNAGVEGLPSPALFVSVVLGSELRVIYFFLFALFSGPFETRSLVAQAVLERVILLLPQCSDYRLKPPHGAFTFYFE